MTNSKLTISRRSELLVQSEIRNMSIECDAMGGINLSQGVCDMDVPEIVKKGAHDAIEAGYNFYTRYDGLPEIREAIARKCESFNHLKVDPEKNVIVSGGATGAFYSACLALLNDGDEVIIFEPYYGYHINTLAAAGAVPVFVRMHPPDWTFSLQALEAVITPHTKAIMINTPANPCGKVFSQAELDLLADFCIRHDLFIFTDEIYEYFVYDKHKHISPATDPRIQDRTITISGYSKAYSITGWRIGYCLCDAKWKETIGFINDLVYVCAPSPLQMGVVSGINHLSEEYYQQISHRFGAIRDQLCSTLTDIGLTPFVPQGAYYILADVSKIAGKDGKDRAMNLLRQTGVATVPGNAFYHDAMGDNFVRFCFGKDEKVIDQACAKLSKIKL